MDISEKYEQLAVKIKCGGIVGSGCLFQPDSDKFTYVLTAKHCLEGELVNKATFTKEDIIIKRFQAKEDDIPLTVIDFKLHEETDIAVIIVEYIKDLPSIGIAEPHKNSDVTIYGYPNHLIGKLVSEIRHNIGMKISWVHKGSFELTTTNSLMTYYDGAAELIMGFSGCGVYNEVDDNLEIVGIFKGLKSPTGAYEGLCAIDINEVNDMLDSIELPKLSPSCLRNFVPYITGAFSRQDKDVRAILTNKSDGIMGISPKILANLLNEKLFLPYGKNDLTNEKVWRGWVLLLTYLCIDKEECISTSNFSKRITNGVCQNIKFYYSDSLNTLEQIIRHLTTELYDDLKHKDYIVINNPETPGTLSMSNSKIQNIVRKIDSAVLYKNKIMIDDPHCSKDISCVHIHKFAVKFSEIEEQDNLDALYEQIRNCVKEVFDNVV